MGLEVYFIVLLVIVSLLLVSAVVAMALLLWTRYMPGSSARLRRFLSSLSLQQSDPGPPDPALPPVPPPLPTPVPVPPAPSAPSVVVPPAELPATPLPAPEAPDPDLALRARLGSISISLLSSSYAWARFLAGDYAWFTIAIWLVSVCALLLLLTGVSRPRFQPQTGELALALLVFAVGVFLRLYRLDSIPYGINNDGAYSGLIAIDISRTGAYLPWSLDPTQGETFFDYWIVAMLPLFGTTSLAVKAAGALVGICTLPGMYLFARRLYGARTALVATALLAISGWQLIFLRSGWRVVTLPLVETFAFYALFRAFQTRRLGSFALAGALFALALDTYLAARILPVVATLWALVELWRASDRIALLRGYGFALLGFVFAGAPILAYILTNSAAINARYAEVNVLSDLTHGNWDLLLHNLRLTTGLFTVRGNGDDFFIAQPLLDPPARWLFPIGLLLLLWRILRRRSLPDAFVLLAFVLTLVPGLISIAPNGNRAGAAVPLVYLIAALPLVALLGAAAPLQRRFPAGRLLPPSLVALLLLGGAVYTFYHYLGPNRDPIYGFFPQATAMGQYLRTIDDRYDVYLADPRYGRNTLAFMTYEPGDPLDALVNSDVTQRPHFSVQLSTDQFLIDQPRPGRGLAFFFAPWVVDNGHVLAGLVSRYPNSATFTLSFQDAGVRDTAAIVLLVPPPGRSARADVPRRTTLP